MPTFAGLAAHRRLADRDTAAVGRLGVVHPTGVAQQVAQVVQRPAQAGADADVRGVGRPQILIDRDTAAVGRLGVGHPTGVAQQEAQVVQRPAQAVADADVLGVGRPQRLADRDTAAVGRLGVVHPAGGTQQVAQVVQRPAQAVADGDMRGVGRPQRLADRDGCGGRRPRRRPPAGGAQQVCPGCSAPCPGRRRCRHSLGLAAHSASRIATTAAVGRLGVGHPAGGVSRLPRLFSAPPRPSPMAIFAGVVRPQRLANRQALPGNRRRPRVRTG